MNWEGILDVVDRFGLATVALLTVGLFLLRAWMNRFFERDRRRDESTQKALFGLHEKRLKLFEGLWRTIGGICTPSDPTAKQRTLEYSSIEECGRETATWYRTNGIYLDSESRLWTLILREMCAQALRGKDKTAKFSWDKQEWPRLWVVKTALRVSLESALSAPGGFDERGHDRVSFGRNRSGLPKIAYKINGDPRLAALKDQLLVKFKLADRLADMPSDRVKERERIVDQVIEVFAKGGVSW